VLVGDRLVLYPSSSSSSSSSSSCQLDLASPSSPAPPLVAGMLHLAGSAPTCVQACSSCLWVTILTAGLVCWCMRWFWVLFLVSCDDLVCGVSTGLWVRAWTARAGALVLLSLYPLGLIAVSTTHVLHAMTKVLSSESDSGGCGQNGFPLPLEQGTGGPVLILLGHSFWYYQAILPVGCGYVT
jgi:hypothetical protein